MTYASRPIVGIPCCLRQLGLHPFHIAGDKYARAVGDGAGAMPLLIPALGAWWDIETLLDTVDGLLITGSPSNVEPHHYEGPASREGTKHDPARDATTLPLLRAAVARRVPILGICRGHQELNVALGGTLDQHVDERPGAILHHVPREEEQSAEEIYGFGHDLDLVPGGWLARTLGKERTWVNSIHGQAIDRLAPGLVAEAHAADGVIEAVRVPDHPFAVSVQWHPEWRFEENEDSVRLFEAFGDAVRAYRAIKLQREAAE